MKITWDAKAKAVYITLPHKGCGLADWTKEIDGGEVYIDYNSDNEAIGIEILNVTQPIVEDILKPKRKRRE